MMTLADPKINKMIQSLPPEYRKPVKMQFLLSDLHDWLMKPELDAFDKFMQDNPNHIYTQQYKCCGASATVLFFLHDTGIRYTILWPWGQFEKGCFDILQHLEEDFLDWIREYVCCTIAVEYADPIPQYRSAVLFAGTRNVK